MTLRTFIGSLFGVKSRDLIDTSPPVWGYLNVPRHVCVPIMGDSIEFSIPVAWTNGGGRQVFVVDVVTATPNLDGSTRVGWRLNRLDLEVPLDSWPKKA